MAMLTNYSMVRMEARASVLQQPPSATPALRNTEQVTIVTILLCLPLEAGNRTNAKGHRV